MEIDTAQPEQHGRQFYEDRIKLLVDQVGRDIESDGALSKINEIIDAATVALGVSHDHTLSDNIFLSYRGSAFFRKYNFRKRKDKSDLESALRDFGMISGVYPDAPTYVRVLLAKSYVLKTDHPVQARVLLDLALAIVKTFRTGALRERLGKQIGMNIADCLLRIAIRSMDIPAMKPQCEKLLSHGNDAFTFTQPLFFAAKAMLDSADDNYTTNLVRRIMQTLDTASQQPALSKKGVVMLSTSAASLSFALGPEFRELTLSQNLRAVNADPNEASAFRCSIIGRLALDVGRKLLRAGEEPSAEDQFRDSIEWFRKSLAIAQTETNEKFDVVVTHCALGEAYLRLQGIAGGANLGRRALRHFEIAQRIGSPPQEVNGLMGDAHFRIGRYLRDPEHLRRALELKKVALASYKPTREGWSVCSAALSLLYELEGDVGLLQQSIDACISAHELDPAWPWPFLQLASITNSSQVSAEIAERLSSILSSIPLERRDIEVLLKTRAVELTIENTEFERQVLGGRTHVFVLSDQHRLISKSIVLKPTTLANANREMKTTNDFGQYLRTVGLDGNCGLSIPVSIKSIGDAGKCIYAMERAEGQTLADGLNDLLADGQNSEVFGYLELAVGFLAAYHAWRLHEEHGKIEFGSLGREISSMTTILELGADVRKQVLDLANGNWSSLPLVAKKDAHLENWLITPSGLVMIDLESTGLRPACFEVAQLLDDFGVVEVSDRGFQTRLTLVSAYLAAMTKLGTPVPIEPALLEGLYGFFWAMRCGFGLGYSRRHSRTDSLSAQRRLADRQVHYKASLRFLKERFHGEPAGALANLIDSH